MISWYDTAAQAVIPFEPRDQPVSLYVCGITPYDSAHLGHAFTYHVFDVLNRRLSALGLTVRSVRNVTDVDDDILRVARERHVDYQTLADAQIALFDRDMAEIGILAVDAAPRASQHVPEMVSWIERLQQAGAAYAVDGWVYFETATHPSYGRLSRISRNEMITLSRARGADPDDPRKRDPLDFVLWQPSAPDEPRWASPWSDGRPGWHIECTVLATGSLGAPIDIHGGGDDLIFPHHESEIAQAEAAGVSPYARRWLHVAMVQLGGVKMSKSLGNLVFVRDLLDQVAPPAVRLLLASHHYRQSWTYEQSDLLAADERRARYAEAVARGAGLERPEVAQWEAQFWERLDDDLDTPGALRVLDRLATRLLSLSEPGGEPTGALVRRLLDVLGAQSPSPVP